VDIPAVCWLSSYLANWPSTLLVVSHDREFLDTIATDIIHMHDERVDVYRGNFSSFESTREERHKQALREYESQMQYRQHLQSFVDRWRYNAKRAAQAQSKMKILEKLPEIEVPTEEIQTTFSFPDPEKVSGSLLHLDEVTFGYTADNVIVRDVNLGVQMDSRIAVVGPNGSGKSTVLK
jgi:ATP-binding cassette subfamily F protein 3